MELEQRVKTLEYEMKILKNEIQRTLLDIQEQILVHYYPALRSEEDQVPETARQTIQNLRASSPAPAAPPPAPPIENIPAAPPPAAQGDAPVIRKVTLDELRAAQNPPPAVVAVPPPAAAPSSASDAASTSKLLEWTLNASAAIGLERITALLGALTERKILTPETQQTLLQIAPLNRRAAPEVVGMREVIQVITQLDAILGRPLDIEEALALIEEAKIG